MIRDMHMAPAEEETGYLVSVSDMMAGLLFIFIITLVAFVIQFQDAKDTLTNQVDELTNNRTIRGQLLQEIQRELKSRGIEVEVDQELGVLRLTEKAIEFRTNKAELDEEPRRNLAQIAEVLARLLPCFANQGPSVVGCKAEYAKKLEAVFIEGHTDNVAVDGREDYNWQLSARRAIATYQFMLERQPGLAALLNSNEQPLFSVAGYAAQRPVVAHEAPTDEPRNRRIDMRFIMTPPKETPEIIRAIRDEGIR